MADAPGSRHALGSAARRRYDSLDIWRGVACLLVLVNHAVFYAPASGEPQGLVEHAYTMATAIAARLWIGVPVFFVISGYCISASADSQRQHGTPVSTYFLKRFRRIFPPYWIVLVATVLCIGAGDVLSHGALVRHSDLLRPWWYSGWQWLGSATLTETWRGHLVGGQKALILGQAWTLCYEEQFYAVTGLLLFFSPRRFFQAAAIVTGLVALTALSARADHRLSIQGFFFDGAWIQFALGILLYYVLNYCESTGRRIAAAVFTVVALAAAYHPQALLETAKNPAQEFFVAGLFALLALGLRPLDDRLMRAPALRPLRLCGVMCYSLYLIHLPAIDLVRAGLQAGGVHVAQVSPLVSLPFFGAISIWLSWQFHRTVEHHFMSRRPPAPAQVMSATLAAT